MLSSTKFSNYSKKILMENKLLKKNNKLVIKKMALYIDMLIFNITTISSIIALLLFNKDRLDNEIINLTKQHISTQSSKKIIGGMMPATYFGADESNTYSADAGGDILQVNFESGTLRPQIGGCEIMTCKINKNILGKISKILKEYKIKADKNIKIEICKIVKLNIYKMVNLLKTKIKNKELSIILLNKILLKSKYKNLII